MKIALLIALIVSLIIAIPRFGMENVWTDTGIKIVMKQGIAANPIQEGEDNHSTGYPVGSSMNVWKDSVEMSRYAPITSWQIAEQLKIDDKYSVILIALTWGLLAGMIYLLALEITRKKITALLSTLLFSFSIPGIQIAWTLYNTQPLIEFLIVFGIFSYIKYCRTNQARWFVALLVSCIVAPLVRELAIIVPLVVFSDTILTKRWDKKILVTFPLILLYNVFPSAIPNLFFGKPVFLSVFSRGAPLLYMGSEITKLGLSMSAHLLLYISPILILLAAISATLSIRRKLDKAEWVFWYVIMGLCFVSLFFTDVFTTMANTALLMGIVIFNRRKILAIWLIISWFPFFWLYNGADTILAASAIPLSIIVMEWIYRLLAKLGNTRSKLMIPIALSLLMGFASLPLNLFTVNRAFSGNVEVTREISSWLKANTPKDSIVISNLIHGEELQDYSDGWFVHYYGFSMPSFPYSISNPKEYTQLVQDNKEVYLVAGLSLPDGENHWLFTQRGINLELRETFTMSESYPISDPLKAALPLASRPYGGAPDLVNEIRVLNADYFRQQAYAKYGIYKVTQ